VFSTCTADGARKIAFREKIYTAAKGRKSFDSRIAVFYDRISLG